MPLSDASIQVVVLELGDEAYGIEISHIQEIVRLQPTRSVPDAPADIDGITCLRGSMLPVVDLRRRLGVRIADASPQSRLVVTDVGIETVALVVDGVSEILTISPDQVDAPDALTASEGDLVLGVAKVNGRMIVVIDPYALLAQRTPLLEAVG